MSAIAPCWILLLTALPLAMAATLASPASFQYECFKANGDCSAAESAFLQLPPRQHASLAEGGQRKPFGWATSGGGNRAMTISLAFARAFAMDDLWPHITHIGSVSGGTWFTTMMFYGKTFFPRLTDLSLPLTEMLQLFVSALPAAKSLSLSHQVCNEEDTSDAGWAALIDQLLGGEFEDFRHTRHTAASRNPAPALRKVTYITGISLPPSTSLSRVPEGHVDESGDVGLLVNGDLINYSVPVCYVALGPDSANVSGGWQWSSDVELEIGGSTEHIPLQLPPEPLILVTATASSAAHGHKDSAVLRQVQEGVSHAEAREYVCENMKSPDTAPSDLKSPWAWPHYSLNDGAYTENIAAAWTLSRMQAECRSEARTLDCSELRMIIESNNADYQNFASMKQLFSKPGTAPGDIAPADYPGSYLFVPDPAIFEETYESLTWIPYGPPEDKWGKSSESFYWTGTLTTVDNSWYNVKGGDKVKVALFCPNLAWGTGPMPIFNATDFMMRADYVESQAASVAPILNSWFSTS